MVLFYMMVVYLLMYLVYLLSPGFVLTQLSLFALNLVLDFYSRTFLLLLVLISSCVLLWSYYYMDLELNFRRFLSLLLAFLLSMFLLVFFSSLYGALIGWDGLGITSFLLVIYFKNRKSLSGGMLTILTNRLGDCFLLVLLAMQYSHELGLYQLTILLLLTSMTKSAQYPFSSWLPAAMAAPTPVSALVHSSTLVTAGVYLLIRFNNLGTEWLMVVGSLTMTMAGLCACAEMDLKKIVALSTLSQLGVMMVALALNMKSLCFFHLTTHAMFKALLFMCVGVGIHSVYGSQDFRSIATFSCISVFPTLCLTVANVSLAGFPFMSGFYSKDAILESFYSSGMSSLFLIVFLFGVGLTTAYSLKMIVLAFLSGDSGGAVNLNGGGVGWVNKLPLFLLAFFSVCSGSVLSSMYISLTPILTKLDKLLPLIFIMFGFYLGNGIAHVKFSYLSSMWYMTPSSQYISSAGVSLHHAGNLDSGLYVFGVGGLLADLLVFFTGLSRWVVLMSVVVYFIFYL